MKTMIISDIHGYSKNLKRAIEIFNKENCQKLIVLGDLFTPGPFGDEVKEILTRMRFCMLCMRGNNDRFIYRGDLDFNIIEDYLKIKLDNYDVYLTHGDKYNKNNHPFLKNKEILIQGHSHIAWMYEEDNKYFINPGSISLPRDRTGGSFIIYENGKFYLYDIDENLLNCLEIDTKDKL